MSDKNIKYISLLLLLLVAILGIKSYWPKLTPQKSPYPEELHGLKPEHVKKIEIRKDSQAVSLEKIQNTWKTNGMKADADKIQLLLSSLIPSVSPELIAQTDARYADFDLTASASTRITLDAGITFHTGKMSGSGLYARINDKPNVYLLQNLTPISVSGSDWADTTILSVDRTKVTALSFIAPTDRTELVKKDGKWILPSGNHEAKSEKVDAILTALSPLTAQSVYDPRSVSTYPEKPELTLTITENDKKDTLDFYKGETDYLVKRLSDGERFITAEYSVSQILSGPKDIL